MRTCVQSIYCCMHLCSLLRLYNKPDRTYNNTFVSALLSKRCVQKIWYLIRIMTQIFLKLIDNKYQWMDCIRHDQTVNKALDGRDTGNLYLRWIFFLHRTVDLHSVCNSSPRVSHWFIGDINSNYNEINTTASAMLHLIYYSALSDFFHT